MAIEKAKTYNEQIKVKKEDLEKSIAEYDKAISLLERELELRLKSLKIQKKNPKVMNPNFGFETLPEYEEFLIEQWEVQYEKQKNAIDADLRRANDHVKQLKMDLLKMGDSNE